MPDVLLSGRCACGGATWKSTSTPQHLDFCYCTQCQQVTGAPFGAWTGIKRDAITWDGPIAKYKISDIATRALCVQCGGTLSIQYDLYPDKTHVAAGTIVTGAELVPKAGAHIFVKSKPVWFSLPDDGVVKWEEFDDEFEKLLGEWEAGKKKA